MEATHEDGRAERKKELQSLIDRGTTMPALDYLSFDFLLFKPLLFGITDACNQT